MLDLKCTILIYRQKFHVFFKLLKRICQVYADEDCKQGKSTPVKDAVLPRMSLFEVVVKYCFKLFKRNS